MQGHTETDLNAKADRDAGVYVEVSFHDGLPGPSGASEVAVDREVLSWSLAGVAGAHPRQVARVGRAWTQMMSVTIPPGVVVTHVAFRDSGGAVRCWRDVPQQTGPLTWAVSFPLDAIDNP